MALKLEAEHLGGIGKHRKSRLDARMLAFGLLLQLKLGGKESGPKRLSCSCTRHWPDALPSNVSHTNRYDRDSASFSWHGC